MRRLCLLALLAVVVAACGPRYADLPLTPSQTIAEAEDALRRGEYATAANGFADYLATGQQTFRARAYYQLAQAQYGLENYEGALATLGDLEVTLSLPDWYNAGVDLYLNGAMRLGGGILVKSQDPELSGVFDAPQQIGGRTYTPQEIGTLVGVFDSSDQVPYALIGFGRHTASGIGLFIDLGVAFLGEPDVRLDAEGGTLDPDTNAQFRQALDDEAAEFEADVGTYLKLWPILSLGFRIGLG